MVGEPASKEINFKDSAEKKSSRSLVVEATLRTSSGGS